jgi:hypothetical protein
VRDFIQHADWMQKSAETEAERAQADQAMTAAEDARERAGGNLDMKMRGLCDAVWPARETRQ